MPRLHDPAVSLTDAALGLEAAVLAIRLAQEDRRPETSSQRAARTAALRRSFVSLFAATSVASSCGALLHGVATDPRSIPHRALWRASLVAIGLAALSGWSIGARLALPSREADRVVRLATLESGAYALVVSSRDLPYWVALANYLPAAAFLSGALARAARGPGPRRPALLGLVALALTFIAAAVQARKIALHRFFDHNALYHAIQAVAVALFFRSAQGLTAAGYERR